MKRITRYRPARTSSGWKVCGLWPAPSGNTPSLLGPTQGLDVDSVSRDPSLDLRAALAHLARHVRYISVRPAQLLDDLVAQLALGVGQVDLRLAGPGDRRWIAGRRSDRRARPGLPDGRRQVVRRDPYDIAVVRTRQIDRGEQGAAQLAHVERPRVAKHESERVEVEADPVECHACRAQDSADQEPEILSSLAQRRDAEAQQAEPGEQVLAELSFRNETLEPAVGGRHHADVHRDLPVAPDGSDLVVLEDPQELHLEPRRHLAHLVEQQGASGGGANEAFSFGLGAGERAADVPEQLVLEECFGQGRAVHAHQGTGAP